MYQISIILLISLINSAFACTGCVDLDSLSFEKTIIKFKTALVKFDVSFPYGPSHENFATFSQKINNKTIVGHGHPDVLIATIGVKDYGDNENKEIADRYQIKPEQFPVIKLFNDGNLESPVHFERGTADVTVEKLFLFLKKHSNTYIQAPGCDKDLDILTGKFMSEKGQRTVILKQTEDAVEKIKSDKKKNLAKFYVVCMKGIIENGEEFIQKQNDRMTKLLKDKLSEKKIEELTKKINILSSFKLQDSLKDEL